MIPIRKYYHVKRHLLSSNKMKIDFRRVEQINICNFEPANIILVRNTLAKVFP